MKKMSTKMAQSKAHSSGTAELLLEIGVEELPAGVDGYFVAICVFAESAATR